MPGKTLRGGREKEGRAIQEHAERLGTDIHVKKTIYSLGKEKNISVMTRHEYRWILVWIQPILIRNSFNAALYSVSSYFSLSAGAEYKMRKHESVDTAG